MIERYYKLDVDMFYRDFKGNKRLLRELEAELKFSAHPNGFDYSETRVDGGLPGDPTAAKAFQRLSIEKRIARLEEYFDMEKKVYDMLDDDEKVIADSMKDGKSVVWLESALFLSESQVRVKVARFKRKVRDLTKWV